MLEAQRKRRKRRINVGADKVYDSRDVVGVTRTLHVILHVTKDNKKHRSNPDRRTTRHAG